MKVHFLGIGGIGVSALAQYYLAKGHKVSGSDLVFSEITNLLKKRGAKITIGKNVAKKDANLTIYSPAVTVHPRGVHTMSYPEALGELTKQHFTIAVCGTHGKSTTTAMLSLILIKAGFDPTVIIGTKLKEFGNGNFRAGGEPKRNVARTLLRGRNVLVIEADEHFGSFLNYWPEMIIVTNIEADHLDYYKNLKNVKKSFKKFIGHLPKGGILIQNSNIKNQNDNLKLKKILKVPGGHNVYDASLALTAARALKITDKISLKALSKYKGAWRRFEIIKTKPFILVSDYGHNPQKVMAALKAAREKWPKKEIWCVYQPHQYQRTYYLFDDFVKAFKTAPVNRIIITDIYDVAGREETATKKQINSQKLVQAINKKKVIYLPKDKIINYLQANMQSGQIIIIVGAGDIYLLTDELEKMKI